mgnify:CR=1 FL=1
MDTFVEQIIRVKRTGKDYLALAAIWLVALGLIAVLWLILGLSAGMLSVPAVVGMAFVIWGGVKLTSLTYIEYEYIFTNRDFDIDKIVGKSTRKRVLSFKVPSVQKYGEYTPEVAARSTTQKVYHFCDKDAADAMYIVVTVQGEGTVMIVFQPNERLKKALEENIPRIAF